ncbi:MAG TPA: carbon-nitrogen hydrolase family protein [Anaerolineae bacterium]|nr:carbon-nitrogen hydrolase family protein [Anaerolineae bacterium]
MTSKFKSFLYNEQAAIKRLKVASVAMSCDRDPDANHAKIADTLSSITQTHPDIKLVIFGEMILGWYNPGGMPEYHRRISQPISNDTLQPFSALAVQHAIHLCFGMSEIDGKSLYNTQVLLNPEGQVQAIHRKWNLKSGEKNANYQPGPVPVTITDIKGIKTGIVICSDAASPHAMWKLMKSRLDLIILSLADDIDKGLFIAKFNARMYDAWVVTANRYGDENGSFWNGHMVISDPVGRLRATGQDQEQYLVYEVKCSADSSWPKRVIRNVYVKAPLFFHVLRNWKMIREYL